MLTIISQSDAAGQHVCPAQGENVTIIDEVSQLLDAEKLRPTMFSSGSETRIAFKTSSMLSAPTKLTMPNAIANMAAHKKKPAQSPPADERNETSGTFLPFDKWKEAKLKEDTAAKRPRTSRPLEIGEGDAIGDGMEVELGFFSNMDDNESVKLATEAGKHSFNFASLDCAATIVKTNPEASGATSILIDNKDKYLLNPCSVANKFVVIELCQDILVEEVAIANFEFFSSTFKRVRFSVSDRYPVAKNGWTVLNEFEAENCRNLQKFPIKNPQIWARFLLIEILSHHDNEYYCPISFVQVHGKTMMDEFKMDNSGASTLKAAEDEIAQKESFELELHDVENCHPWPSIDFEHVSVPSKVLDTSRNCTCRLAPLKFEEFLRDLNDTYCPAPLKDLNHPPTSSAPSATTEDSIFKNIMKRLSLLESNTTLSVLYMEEQGKLLSDSFNHLEKAQISKFDNLVSIFNDTMMDNLNVLRNFANQLKDQSIKILEEQKLNNDQFTTQNWQKIQSLEQELKNQRNIVYATSFGAASTVLYLVLSRESKLDEANRKVDHNPIRISSLPTSPISLSGSSITSE